MISKTIQASYVLTEDLNVAQMKTKALLGKEVWFFNMLAWSSLVLVLCLLGGGLGILSLIFFEIGGAYEFMIVILGFVCGLLTALFFAEKVKKKSGAYEINTNKIGTQISYEFSPDGFRMKTKYQDWKTKWIEVFDISIAGQFLVIKTPYTAFVVAISALGSSAEKDIALIRVWHREMRKKR
ncbi:MAG: hypothetical protein AAGA97_05280 [Pseudomonadota bacterium]